jgi:catechol 2,3-dioxygenase-like lactoylglutathione lyase family enzyme
MRMTEPKRMFHVGIVVPDLEAAQAEMGAALGVTWRPVRDARYGEWDIRVSYSVEGPPYVELIEGSKGGPWTTQGAPRLDHFGVWSEDVPAEVAALLEKGLAIDFDPRSVDRPPTFCYLRSPATGTRIELVSTALRQVRGLE